MAGIIIVILVLIVILLMIVILSLIALDNLLDTLGLKDAVKEWVLEKLKKRR